MFTNIFRCISLKWRENMPTKTVKSKSRNAKPRGSAGNKTKKKEEEKVNMDKLQSTLCRDILDTAEVTKSQVASAVIENFSDTDRDQLKEIVQNINALVDQQSNALVDRVIKTLS